MAEEKKTVSAPPSKPKVVPRMTENEPPKLKLPWLKIGQEVELFLGLDDNEANVIKSILSVYPAVKKLIVKPLIQAVSAAGGK